jgi:hypothetical protein
VITYIAGPSGLLAIDTDGTVAWPVLDGCGDVVGKVTTGTTFSSPISTSSKTGAR